MEARPGQRRELLLLVVFLGKVKCLPQLDFSGNLRALARGSQQFLVTLLAVFSGLQQIRIVHIYGAAVLSALVVALRHTLQSV